MFIFLNYSGWRLYQYNEEKLGRKVEIKIKKESRIDIYEDTTVCYRQLLNLDNCI